MQSIDSLWKSISNQFVISSCIGATVGAAAGLATFATISATDYGILYFKKRRGGECCNLDFIEIPSDCAEQRDLYSQNVKNIAAHKLTEDELKKAQPYHGLYKNIYSFRKTNTGFLHKTYTQGTISGTITTVSDAEEMFQPHYLRFDQSTIHNRRWKHAFCGGLIVGGAIAGAYVVGNIVQK
jgi:hypothetical protein